MRTMDLQPTDLFVGTVDRPLQVLRVTLADGDDGFGGPVRIEVQGPGVSGSAVTGDRVTEIGLEVEGRPGAVVPIRVTASTEDGELLLEDGVDLTVAEPGWTMYLISHFHYDPVWWATQAAYAVTWNDADEIASAFRMPWQQPGFDLIDTHLDLARRDPDYKFVVAEVDLLKPYWDARPEQRDYIRRLFGEGRLEVLGGTYNEPNTNLTSAEVTIRNFIYGNGFQRDVLGGDPQTAWQLDAFGHDPQFPGLAADAGVTSSSWARGPFRPWGPMLKAFLPGEEGWGDPTTMQFPSEFEWIAPSGRGLLTHYMPAHYSAGWVLDEAGTLGEAEAKLHELFSKLKQVAATRNVLLPVGTDYTPPNKWITDVHRHWNRTYVWPRFVCAVPAEFFAAVRAELDATGATLSPQSRDMNPIFTGKDVSFIDTKQAHRTCETALVDAEKFAVFARAHGAAYPDAALDKAWRHLIFGAHHDAVTGSESDQVYLDLLTNWHEAADLAEGVLAGSLRHLCGLVEGSGWTLTVFNPSSWRRDDLVEARVQLPAGAFTGLTVQDGSGQVCPAMVEVLARHDDASLSEVRITLLADDVPGLGYRSWRLTAPDPAADAQVQGGWQDDAAGPVTGNATISSARYELTVDAAHGGCVTGLLDRRHDRQVVPAGEYGNALLRNREYAEHPTFNEGPWHLLPTRETASSADAPALSVRTQSSPLGRRIVVEGVLDCTPDDLRYRQTLTLWDGVDRLDCVTELHSYTGSDQLFRVRWPAAVSGSMPVSEVGNAVIGRGHALIDVDSAEHPWTLDNPAYGFFALSTTARVTVTGPDSAPLSRPVNAVEIVSGQDCRELAVALVRAGVTATTSAPAAPRFGHLAVDSSLPDARIGIGTPALNPFTAEVLGSAPEHAREFERQLAATGRARVWVPASTPLAKVWQPGADLRGVRSLPALLVAGDGSLEALAADLDDAVIEVAQSAGGHDGGPDFEDFTVGMINRGTPGFAVDTQGALHMSLMRSCTGWPSGVWIDPPVRRAPDGSAFQEQHWSHRFEYAIASDAGDWRQAGLVPQAHDVNHRLIARVHEASGGTLPGRHAFLTVESDGDVVVTAVKAAGNPMATGGTPQAGDQVSVRLYEAAGRPAAVRVSGAGLGPGRRLDLLEADLLADDRAAGSGLVPGSGSIELQLAPGEVATLGTSLAGLPAPAAGSASAAAGSEAVFVEPVQPVFSRYWLNNTGTAPAGNSPIAVHIAQTQLVADGSSSGVELTVSVSSTLNYEPVRTRVEIPVPPGWSAEPAGRDVVLGPGAHTSFTVRVVPAADAAPGCYLVPAVAEHRGQQVQDLCRVLVGGAAPEQVVAELTSGPQELAPGTEGCVEVRLTSDAATAVPAQVQLITPWDLWPSTPGWNSGAEIPAGGSAQLRFPVVIPPGAEPGQWWAIVKVAAAGRVQFTESVEIRVPAP